MLKMYKGIDAELDDWPEVPLKDVFKMTPDVSILIVLHTIQILIGI